MTKEIKLDTNEEREAFAAQAMEDEELLGMLAEWIAGSSRVKRQKAASTIASISNIDASVLLPYVDEISSGLSRSEAQTRWEVLHTLDQMGKAGQRYSEDVIAAAEEALYDENNGIVRQAAFRLFHAAIQNAGPFQKCL